MRPAKASRVWAAAKFVAPLIALVVLWEVLVRALDVNPPIFPSVAAVARAGWEALLDGTLIRHIGASLGRVAVGHAARPRPGIPLGIAMGVNLAVSTF